MVKDRFILQRSTERPNAWVATDQAYGIVIVFDEHQFNDTQKVTLLEDYYTEEAQELAAALQQMGDWLVKEHSDITF